MPSKRPSLSAMDATAAPASPSSPPRSSKKRSSRPKPDARHPVPNPSPIPAAATVAASSSRNRERERKRKQRSAFADPAAAVATAPTAPAHAAGAGAAVVQKQLWNDADVVALLGGAAAFRARTGRVPRFPDMAALYDSIRGSISPHIDQAKVYYKLKRIKGKYLHAVPGAAAGPHERRVRDLCASVWGADLEPLAEAAAEQQRAVPVAAAAAAEKPRSVPVVAAAAADQPRTVPDAAAMLPVLTEMLDEYWKTDGRALSGVALEKGLSLLGTGEARFIESKWRRQLDSEIQTQMQRHDLAKEVYALLMDAIKGLGP